MAIKKGLGKGLDALFLESGKSEYQSKEYNAIGNISDKLGAVIQDIEIHNIKPNHLQPRRYFDDENLKELAESIKEFGIIQPIIVKKDNEYYSIIAGERRWRAARLAELKTIPAIVKDFTDAESLEAAIIENVQRTDLNPMEEAFCYQKLIEEYSFTQEQLSKRIGKNRSYISNAIRLLALDEEIQILVSTYRLSMGHARALLPIVDKSIQLNIVEKILDKDLNVRQTEELVKDYLSNENNEYDAQDAKETDTNKNEKKSNSTEKDKPHVILTAENDLRDILGTQVYISDGKRKGKIEIEYYSSEELNRLLLLFKRLYK